MEICNILFGGRLAYWYKISKWFKFVLGEIRGFV